MKAFLIEHDRRSRETRVSAFDDIALALSALREREAIRDEQTEVVLMFADSEQALRTTHSRYFYGPEELVRRGWEEDAAPAVDVAAG